MSRLLYYRGNSNEEQLEKEGAIDRHEKKQPSSQPIIDITFVGTRIEQIWEFVENNGDGK